MDSLRKSPVVRATSWLLTVAMIAPMLMLGRQRAQAQAQQAITVIVSDFVNLRTKSTDALAIQARDAVYNELAASGQGRFNPVPEKEVRTEARQLGIRVPSNPSQPANFSQSDLIRLAKALNAEGIVTGRINVATNKKGTATTVAIDSVVNDVAANDPINGAVTRLAISPRPGEAIEEATTRTVGDSALDLVRQMVQRQLVTATILNVNVETIIINRGTRDGLHVGDELAVLEYQTNGSTISKGRIKVARAYATDAECDSLINNGIRPENIARALYRPNLILDINNTPTQDSARSTRINFSGIGRTLSVIGLGVLIAVAIRGGQQSNTNVTAEPSAEVSSPTVRVRFQDNVFSQAGILQYKIYRDPDFPFSSPYLGGGTGTGTTGGTTGTTTAVVNLPVGTAPASTREFIDRGSPNRFFATSSFLVAGSNGGNNTGGTTSSSSSSGGGTGGGTGGTGGSTGTTTQTCASTGGLLNDTGFTPGRSYRYEVTAIILRQIVTNDAAAGGSGTGGLGGGGTGGSVGTGSGSGGSTGGTGSGGGSTGGGTSGGGQNGGTGSTQCIETDPARSNLATPITPVLITSPTNASTTVNIASFSPSFGSRSGADLFQLEVSTDPSFTNPKTIFRQQVISTAPTTDNVAQNVSTPINLQTATELLSNATFANFVNNTNQTVTPTLPTLYFRVGARRDEDIPGPVAAQDPNNPGQKDRTFRFVYSQVVSFTPVPRPPANPGTTTTGSTGTTASASAILKKAARAANTTARMRTAASARISSNTVKSLNSAPRTLGGHASLSAQEILTGRGRLNRN